MARYSEIKRNKRKIDRAGMRGGISKALRLQTRIQRSHVDGGSYFALTCFVRGKAVSTGRCGEGRGGTPTRAVQGSLRALASRLARSTKLRKNSRKLRKKGG